MTPSIAIITPSYGPDFELCRTLNRSVLEFLPPSVKHYIFVDSRDLKLFRTLAGQRTIVATKAELLPNRIIQLPGINRWIAKSTFIPISGWLVQQIAKIATAHLLNEETLVLVDSDALFVRDIGPEVFVTNGMTRLYRSPGAITAIMKSHVTWHQNACRLLDTAPQQAPMDDYIGQVITWDRGLVKRMCERLEMVNSTSWHEALARKRAISEHLLYGIFVENVLGTKNNVWIDERSRCKTHWQHSPLLEPQVAAFASSIDDGDFAIMISSYSGTSNESRRAAIALATHGRIR